MEKTIINKLNDAINEYIELFSKKHEISFNSWIDGEIGTIAEFDNYYFDFNDIRIDLETDQQKNCIIEWYDINLNIENHINYKSWIRGYRPDIRIDSEKRKIYSQIVNGEITPNDGDNMLIELYGLENCEILILSCAIKDQWYHHLIGKNVPFIKKDEQYYYTKIENCDIIEQKINKHDAIIALK